MGENSTTMFNSITNKAVVRENDFAECTSADALIFYYNLRRELDQMQKKPKQQTIDNILRHSRGLR
jgi:hypothetical protein